MIHSDFLKTMTLNNIEYQVVNFDKIKDRLNIELKSLPFSARIILENLLRNFNTSYVEDVHLHSFSQAYGEHNNGENGLIPFFPSRVLMQDFTGVPAVVDLAAMRDAVKDQGLDPSKLNPSIPVDLVIDHSIQVDNCKTEKAFKLNVEKEYERNNERYGLLKWAAKNFKNFNVVPPGSGICHQVNLEYLAKVVFIDKKNKFIAYPDTLIGTDSHTTMINGMGVLGWGVGGIEAEAVILGEPYYMKLPEIVGVNLIGRPSDKITATDIVLMITEKLRSENVVEKIVEFTGPGINELSLTDRATIANMSPEYGATAGFFPVDSETIEYLKKTSRNKLADIVESYTKECNLFSNNHLLEKDQIKFTRLIDIDLSKIELAIAGPSKPNQRILVKEIPSRLQTKSDFLKEKVLIAAITSCTNTSNPNSMIGAGLVAKKALENGLEIPWYVKTSLSPGSRVVIDYLESSGLMEDLKKLGFNNTGFGCMTCIGNSGPLEPDVEEKILKQNINTAAVLSGNRNFEARIHQQVKSNYLMSPALVVMFALAGRMDIDFKNEPLGIGKNDKPVFFSDIWPEAKEINTYVHNHLKPEFFANVYSKIFKGGKSWDALNSKKSDTFNWNKHSLYIKKPPFFNNNCDEKINNNEILDARVLLVLGDSITTDHISPAGGIPEEYPAGQYLLNNNIKFSDFNTYGSRRGNHEIMMRGTFANIRILNQLSSKKGGYTIKLPEKKERFVYDAAMDYHKENIPLIVFAGKEYGTGSSRDWAAKGTYLLGIKTVVASSFERIHRNNLIGMGVLPLGFKDNQSFESLNLKGDETFSINNFSELTPGCIIKIKVSNQNNQVFTFDTICRLDTKMEITYYKNYGILNYVLNKKLSL